MAPEASSQETSEPPASETVGRMTVTLSAIRSARRIYLLLTGQDEWYAYHQALAQGPVEERPVRALLQDPEVAVRVYWAP